MILELGIYKWVEVNTYSNGGSIQRGTMTAGQNGILNYNQHGCWGVDRQ